MDLTGFWTGTYWYFRYGEPVVPFLANIDDKAGHLTGSISEPDSFTESGFRLEAFLIGERDGTQVRFAKVYDGAGPFAHRVDYSGGLSGDGKALKGSWFLSGEWGGFEMSRQILEDEEPTLEQVEIATVLAMELK